MNELKASGKPFVISKRAVWEAYEKVKANKGAPGVDGVSLAEFEKDLKNNLYKIWNRMSSGTYFPPPVRAVEIPKPHGGGTRILGVPTVGDRIAPGDHRPVPPRPGDRVLRGDRDVGHRRRGLPPSRQAVLLRGTPARRHRAGARACFRDLGCQQR